MKYSSGTRRRGVSFSTIWDNVVASGRRDAASCTRATGFTSHVVHSNGCVLSQNISFYPHHIWSIALYGAETWTLRAFHQKQLESFEMWCWRRMEKMSWTDHVRNEDVLLRAKEQRNILHEIRKRKANWIGHILRRNCLLQRVTEGKMQGGIEGTGRQGRRRRKLLDDFNLYPANVENRVSS
jgi:hypothetical protein